eukprot:1157334-Pelagomonas_calceolata.AAC.18
MAVHRVEIVPLCSINLSRDTFIPYLTNTEKRSSPEAADACTCVTSAVAELELKMNLKKHKEPLPAFGLLSKPKGAPVGPDAAMTACDSQSTHTALQSSKHLHTEPH